MAIGREAIGRGGQWMWAAVAAGLLLFAGEPAAAMDDSLLCGVETARQERLQAIPDRLLHAISLVEAGRWDSDHRANLAWPWTVNAEGEGRFLPTKQAAVAEVRKLQARGIRNIDVGCMQVNLQAHPDAFGSLDEAFDPAANVAYAAQFLLTLFDGAGNWPTAGAYYHSQTPEVASPYKARLLSTWDEVRRQSDLRLQLASVDLPPQNRPPQGVLLPLSRQPADVAPAAAAKPDPLGRSAAERAEAKRVADAYRQAKLEEYRQRKSPSVGG
jgi:hypothetical protein